MAPFRGSPLADSVDSWTLKPVGLGVNALYSVPDSHEKCMSCKPAAGVELCF